MKKISILTPCYNEEMNVELLYNRVTNEMSKLYEYDYEFIFIDNDSSDNTVNILKKLAALDKRLKIIVNIKNFNRINNEIERTLKSIKNRIDSLKLESMNKTPEQQ